jgi:hypothetical protein
MLFKKQAFVLYFLLVSFHFGTAQIEVARASVKGFNAIGYGGFLNFAFPVSDANYITIEGGAQQFKNDIGEELIFIPVLLGYRYTLNQTGLGLYVEPFAGYSFGSSTIQTYDEYGSWTGDERKVSGATAGTGLGYLVELGRIPFNFSLRYGHTFGNSQTNIVSFRIAHSFSFRKRESDY